MRGGRRERERGCTVESMLARHVMSRSPQRKKKGTDQLGVDRTMAGCERDGRTPRFDRAVSRGRQQPYLGVHRAEFRPQTQILPLVFRFAVPQGREQRRWNVDTRIDDKFASDGVLVVGQGEKVGRFGFERVREDVAPAGDGFGGRGVGRGRLRRGTGSAHGVGWMSYGVYLFGTDFEADFGV